MLGVSYVISIYNKQECIKEMVEGLTSQIGEFAREFIFVDDGSTDKSLTLLKEYTANIDNVTIISQKNSGPSIAVNNGARLARFDYIKLLDGDDKLLPKATKILLDLISNTGCGVVRGVHVNIYDENIKTDNKVEIITDPLKRALRFMPIGGSTCLIKTDLFREVGGCDERVFVQDYSIALRLAAITNFAVINKIIAHNINGNQQRLSSNKFIESRDTALARYYYVKDHPALNYELKLHALRAHLKKCWSWYRKNNSLPIFNKIFLNYFITRFKFIKFPQNKILLMMQQACEIYNKNP
jgi:glycosyltransferase involved in cell wall biosynthesis